MADTYGFSEDAAERIAETVRRSENTPRRQTLRRGPGPHIDSNLLEVVRVTSATQTSSRHPGQIQVYDESTGNASDLAATQDAWVRGLNNETLTTTKYLCRRQEHAGSPSLPVFRAVAAVGSTSGVTGSRTLYKYACVSGSLTEYSAAVTLADGLVTAWASSYT